MGLWPKFYDNSAFASQKDLNSFWRQMTPNTAPYNDKVIADAVTDALKKSEGTVLVTHSQGCGPGWLIGTEAGNNLKGIIAFEPGSGFIFRKAKCLHRFPITVSSVRLKLSVFPLVSSKS